MHGRKVVLMLPEDDLSEAQKQNHLLKLPSLIEFLGYCLCCGSHFAGPVFEIKDYLEWTERKGIWTPSDKGRSPSPYWPALRAILQATICMALYLYLSPSFPLTRFTEPIYQEWGFWKRIGYQYMAGFTARWKYYFIWSISESSIIISGLGFSGWTNSLPPKARWDRAKNVDIIGVEFAKKFSSTATCLEHTSQYMATSLCLCKTRSEGKKTWFLPVAGYTYCECCMHGLYPGYFIFFVQSSLMIAGSRVIYKWQQYVPPEMAMVKDMLVFMNFLYTFMVLNCSFVGFMVLSLHETLTAYKSVYFIATIVPILLVVLGKIIKPAKPARTKARKEE